MISPVKTDTLIFTILIVITIASIIIIIIIIIINTTLVLPTTTNNNNKNNSNQIYGFTCFSAQGQNRIFCPYTGKFESGNILILELS